MPEWGGAYWSTPSYASAPVGSVSACGRSPLGPWSRQDRFLYRSCTAIDCCAPHFLLHGTVGRSHLAARLICCSPSARHNTQRGKGELNVLGLDGLDAAEEGLVVEKLLRLLVKNHVGPHEVLQQVVQLRYIRERQVLAGQSQSRGRVLIVPGFCAPLVALSRHPHGHVTTQAQAGSCARASGQAHATQGTRREPDAASICPA